MKKYLFCGLFPFILCTSAISGPAPMDVPYAPSEEVQAGVNIAPGWTEIYRVEVAEQDAKLRALVDHSQTPPALAVGVGGMLHFSQGGAPSELEEVSFGIKRDGMTIDYDDDCMVLPLAGDVLETVYRSSDKTAEITTHAVILEHHAFGIVGELAMEAIRLDLSKPEHCAAITESRILASGTLIYKINGGTSFKEPILYQAIAAP
jgi:hypothetical protein